jgi:PAS domain S-box-containing protein
MAGRKNKSGKASRPQARPARELNRLDLAMRALNEGLYEWDIAAGKIYYSDAVYRILKMPRDMKTPGAWRKRIHRDDLADYDRRIVEHFKGLRAQFECSYRFRARDGKWRWARQHGVAVRDKGGRALRMVGSIGDISELKRVEQALKESQDRYALATQAATEGIYEWNIATGSLFLSERGKEFFAVKGGSLTPAVWNRRVHRDDFPGYRDALVAFLKSSGAQFEHEYRIRNASDGYSWIVDRAVAERDRSGRVLRMVGALRDVTQRKLHEEQLRQARDDATAALERQTATADILRVMARSPSDVQPVFDAIAAGATRLCKASFCIVFRYDGKQITVAADGGDSPKTLSVIRARYPAPPGKQSVSARAILERRVISLADAQNLPRQPEQAARAKAIGYHSILAVPMMKGDTAIGTINVARFKVDPFTDAEAELLKTFADQAVIAIENVRLFNQTKEALEQQTASSEILGAISNSPTDSRPVFDAILASAIRLCGAHLGLLNLYDGEKFRTVAQSGGSREFRKWVFERGAFNMSPGTTTPLLQGKLVHFPDANDYRSGDANSTKFIDLSGTKTYLAVPLVKEGKVMGVIAIFRPEVRPFSDKQIDLVKTFASQAVIAIENARLFNETRRRSSSRRRRRRFSRSSRVRLPMFNPCSMRSPRARASFWTPMRRWLRAAPATRSSSPRSRAPTRRRTRHCTSCSRRRLPATGTWARRF